MSDAAASSASSAPSDAQALVFEWRHRPRTWLKLSFWLVLALLAHLGCFYLFSVRTPPPARAVPLPASVILAGRSVDPLLMPAADPAAHIAVPTAGLDLPEIDGPAPYVPSFEGHTLPRDPWPARPTLLAWPDVSGISEPVLPPAPAASTP